MTERNVPGRRRRPATFPVAVRCASRFAVAAVAAALLAFASATRDASAGDKGKDAADPFAAWRRATAAPLVEKVDAAEDLARIGTAEALEALLVEWARDVKNQDRFRELSAPAIARCFGAVAHAPTLLDALARRLDTPQDPWLLHRLVRVWMLRGDVDLALDAADLFSTRPFHRAAALRGLAANADPRAFAAARRILCAPPEAPLDRALAVEAAAAIVEANAATIADPLQEIAIEALITELERPGVARRTKIALGRSLARTLKSPVAYAHGGAWRDYLASAAVRAKLERDGYAATGHSYFFGVRITGRDIVYVIDSSGSMGDEFKWRPPRPGAANPPAGPTTGGDGDAERKARRERAEKERQDAFRGLEGIPWDKVRTRLDAVREALKASLRALDPDQRFAIVVFSDDARTLDSTSRLVSASRVNVELACSAVDRLHAAGGTNIHRGLELAFGLTTERSRDQPTGVDDERILRGPDTVILLTDGAPTHDNYSARQGTDMNSSWSAYSWWRRSYAGLLLAAERWNLFDGCEVNCVGLASASTDLLESFAAQGNGRARMLGE